MSLLGRLRRRLAPGASGEGLACRHLEARGYAILERNFRCRSGEIDVVAREGDATVFVEVKDRTGASHGAGYEAVTYGKRRRVVRAARIYAASRGLEETRMRFDVISIEWDTEGPRIHHFEDAFSEDG